MEACVTTVNVATTLDDDGLITVAVQGEEVFKGNLIDALATCNALQEVVAESGYAAFCQPREKNGWPTAWGQADATKYAADTG